MAIKEEALKKYFDILLQSTNDYKNEHPLMGEDERFKFYSEVRDDFGKIGTSLEEVSASLAKNYQEYTTIIQKMAYCFNKLSKIGNQEFDVYIRSLVVERLIHSDVEAKDKGGREVLGYLLEGMLNLLFDGQEEITQISKKTFEALKNKEYGEIFKKSEDKKTNAKVSWILMMYEQLEEELKTAKQGVIAQDKKMLQLLQILKAEMGQDIIQMAMDNAVLNPEGPARIDANIVKKILQAQEETKKKNEQKKLHHNIIHGFKKPDGKGGRSF